VGEDDCNRVCRSQRLLVYPWVTPDPRLGLAVTHPWVWPCLLPKLLGVHFLLGGFSRLGSSGGGFSRLVRLGSSLGFGQT
jgi:hypothetical protein